MDAETATPEEETVPRFDSAPWVAGESLGGGRGVWLEGDDEDPICRIGDRPDAAEVQRLIAVAPALLAELRRLSDWVEAADADASVYVADAVARARLVIARAAD